MNTATVLVFTVFTLAVFADYAPCQKCQSVFDEVRVELGNDGKGASIEALLAVFQKLCKRDDPQHAQGCYDVSAKKAPEIKNLLDAGESNKDICIYLGICV
uniref:Saposin B-type domain-containing protein n=1 Tax=Panagrellus redivivus TaxID=6233 RepID=A0A7E4UXL8_PANRE